MRLSPRPVYLNLLQIRLPVTAIVSILHRISGVYLSLVFPIAVFLISQAVASEEGFSAVQSGIESCWIRQTLIGFALLAYLYHALAGIRHLLMDCGLGLSLQSARCSAKILLIVYVISIVTLLGAKLWG